MYIYDCEVFCGFSFSIHTSLQNAAKTAEVKPVDPATQTSDFANYTSIGKVAMATTGHCTCTPKCNWHMCVQYTCICTCTMHLYWGYHPLSLFLLFPPPISPLLSPCPRFHCGPLADDVSGAVRCALYLGHLQCLLLPLRCPGNHKPWWVCTLMPLSIWIPCLQLKGKATSLCFVSLFPPSLPPYFPPSLSVMLHLSLFLPDLAISWMISVRPISGCVRTPPSMPQSCHGGTMATR